MFELRDNLRKRWTEEYISALRTYAQQQTRSFSVGDIALMCDDQNKRQDWKLARVTEVFKGKDGKVRVVRVFTGGKEFLRSIQKLVPLEIPAES